MENQMPTPVLVMQDKPGTTRVELYLLNPGDHFPEFGGSRHSLVVKKTASLVVRERSPWSTRDTEYDTAEGEGLKTWQHYARCLADGVLVAVRPDDTPL